MEDNGNAAPEGEGTAATSTTSETSGGEATTVGGENGSTNTNAESWLDGLSPELRVNPVVQRYKEPEQLAKAYVELNKVLSSGNKDAHLLTIPADEDEGAWNEVFTKLGRPETHADYDLKFEFPEGMEADEVQEKVFRESAHKHGLSAKQASGVYNDFVKAQVNTTEETGAQIAAARLEAEKAIKKEWGAAYEDKLKGAAAAIEKYGSEPLVKYLDETKLGNDPEMLKFVDSMLKDLGSDTVDDGGGEGERQIVTPEEATAKINMNYASADFMKAYRDSTHPSHGAKLAEMERLFKLQAGVKP